MKKLFWGLFFIVAGAFVIVDQLVGYTDIGLFSLICTIFLIPIFISSLFKLNFTGILFSVAFLAIIYKEPLNIENINSWSILLTALLGSIGLSILFNKRHFHKGKCYRKCGSEHFDEVINSTDGEEVDFNVNFGSSIKYINSNNFKRADLRCNFGAMKAYFDNAKMVEDNAIINLDVSFGGVELYFPKEWRVINKVNNTLGAVEEKNNNREKTEKTVTLTGKVSLGGVEILYV